ncbi:MAG: DUF6932 family protein [Methylococcales bacterium]
MTLPLLDEHGNLPAGIHSADLEEIGARFDSGTPARVRGFHKLKFLHNLGRLRGRLKRFLIFGSFVSDKAEPRDVDVVLIMDADFKVEECRRESKTLFSHADADAKFGASVFWMREGMLLEELMMDFFDVWQTRRDGKKSGMLELIDDTK